jgi:hypothetical protein
MKALTVEPVSSWFIGRYEYCFRSNVVGLLLTVSKGSCAVLRKYRCSLRNVYISKLH